MKSDVILIIGLLAICAGAIYWIIPTLLASDLSAATKTMLTLVYALVSAWIVIAAEQRFGGHKK